MKSERLKRYPAEWAAISERIRYRRAGNRCECVGQCGSAHEGRCDAPNGETIARDPRRPWEWTRSLYGGTKVILTVAHVNHDESDNRDENLLALCQRCHLVMDGADNAARRREARDLHCGQRSLFEERAALPERRR